MDEPKAGANGLLGEVQDAYGTYIKHTFTTQLPTDSRAENWKVRGERFAKVVLGMPFIPIVLFRIRNWLLQRNIPLMPYVCDLISTTIWHVTLGRFLTAAPGLLLPHGHVVIDGIVTIGRDCVINPWVTVGLSNSRRLGFSLQGPTIGDGVAIGTGAKVLGPITVGDRVRIGANAVVVHDVPDGATVVGVPARIVQSAPPDWSAAASSDET